MRFFSGEASQKEIERIEKWLAEDNDGSHYAAYRDAHNIFDGITLYSKSPSRRRHTWKTSPLRRVARLAGCAAAVVAVAVASVALGRHITMERLYARTETFCTPAGKSMEITLEDGTHMWMNASTTVEVPKLFRKDSRAIKVLDGEVMMDVAKDAERPFTVHTYAADIKVLGTKFDVSVNEDLGLFSTALLRGSVSIENAGGEVLLRPNEVAQLRADGSLAVSQIKDNDNVVCWTEGMVNLVGIPFDALMKKFEKVFNTTIIIERKQLPQLTITRGKVRISDGVEHALDVLKLATDFKYDYDYNTNTIIIK